MVRGKQFKTGLNNILHILKINIHTNVTVIGVGYSCELFDWCCVSNGGYCCSGKLEGIVEPFNFSLLIRDEHKNGYFTRHSQHLNTSGKQLISKYIATYISSITHSRQA
jgi:hypothetical protein